MGFLWDNCSSR